MKRRMGFVSNSSSCSFVVVGYKVPKDISVKEKLIELFASDKFQRYKEKWCPDWDSLSLSEKDDTLYDCIDLLPFDIVDNAEEGYSSDTHMIIGDEIATSDDEYMEENVISIDNDLTDNDVKLLEFFVKNNIEYERIILTGTRMC